MTVINKCIWVFFVYNLKKITCAYENTLTNYLKNYQSTPFLSLYLKNSWNFHYRSYTIRFIKFFHVCFLHLSRGKLSMQLVLSHPPPVIGVVLIISSWRQDLKYDYPSASRYGEPLRQTKPMAFSFILEYVQCILVYLK